MCLVGKWLQIHSFKHNGRLHRYWEKNYVVEDNENYYIVASNRTQVVESDGRRWYTHEPAITLLSKKDWFNVIAMFKDDGICYYCNIASPSIYDDGKIKYIDYDLDLKLYPDLNIKVLDEKEYEKHRNQYQYDDNLNTILKAMVKKIHYMMCNHIYPFNDNEIRKLFLVFKTSSILIN